MRTVNRAATDTRLTRDAVWGGVKRLDGERRNLLVWRRRHCGLRTVPRAVSVPRKIAEHSAVGKIGVKRSSEVGENNGGACWGEKGRRGAVWPTSVGRPWT